MKRLVLLTLVALRVATLCGQEKEGLFTGTVQSMSFAGFADTLESQTGVRIFSVLSGLMVFWSPGRGKMPNP